MDEDVIKYIRKLNDLVKECANEQLEKSKTYEKALSNLRHQQLYSLNQYSTELINMVSDEISKRALTQKINRSKH